MKSLFRQMYTSTQDWLSCGSNKNECIYNLPTSTQEYHFMLEYLKYIGTSSANFYWQFTDPWFFGHIP